MAVLKLPVQVSRFMVALIILILMVFSPVKTERHSPSTGLDGRKCYYQAVDDINTMLQIQSDPEYKNVISQIKVLSDRPFWGENGYITQSLLASPELTKGHSDYDTQKSEPLSLMSVVQSDQGTENETLQNFTRDLTIMEDIVTSLTVNPSDKAIDNITGTTVTSPTGLSTTIPTSLPLSTRETTIDNTTDTTTTSSTTNPTSDNPSIPVSTSLSPLEKTKCLNDLELVLQGLNSGENWALQLVDAWGKPGPSVLEGRLIWVGTYKQCRNVQAPVSDEGGSGGFNGNYCLVMTTLGNAITSADPQSMFKMSLFHLGTCMPDSCSELEITAMFDKILGLIPMGNSSNSSRLTVFATECRTDEREFTTASVFAIVILSIIGGMMILGTAYDLAIIQWPKWTQSWNETTRLLGDSSDSLNKEKMYSSHDYQDGEIYSKISGDEQNRALPVVDSEARPLLAKSEHQDFASRGLDLFGKTLVAFSVYTNGSKVLNTTQPPGSLSAINGIRFLSMSWVILGHMYIFGMGSIENIATALSDMTGDWTYDAITNALFSVDTFFTLSGLLTSYLAIKDMKKKGWKINWPMFYFHRFWRLTPPYMFVLVIVLGLQRFMGSGALWSSTQPVDKVNCEENWWTNLLYINNLVNSKAMCMGHSWYLANDMQFFIVSPLMIIPFYFNKFAGFASCMIFLLAQWITTGVLSSSNNWPATFVSSAGMDFSADAGMLDWMSNYYYTPYCRIGPFVIGILAGYLLASTNNGDIRMKKQLVVIGWVVAIATGLALVYGVHGSISGENPLTIGVAAFYNAVARSAWGACVCWVIIACVSGYGGPVNALLSWSPFVPLGRLTYMAYLIHPSILYIYYGNMEKLFFLNDTNMIFAFLGILFFTYLAAFVFMLGLESPMVGLEKVFLGKFKR